MAMEKYKSNTLAAIIFLAALSFWITGLFKIGFVYKLPLKLALTVYTLLVNYVVLLLLIFLAYCFLWGCYCAIRNIINNKYM